ncbi:MAG TPA: amidase family protein, partial [Ktedonobacterales bacterium]|nr:amidase family protein [Ktedonobacterales bacterium]
MAEAEQQIAGATTDPAALTASELAQQIRDGALSSVDAVDAHIRRIEAVNPKINAVIFPMFEQARAAAKAADAARARGEPMGPLHGVPITIKDQFEV